MVQLITVFYAVCGTPPLMVNGRHFGPNRPLPNTVINYTCNKGYFAFGSNSQKFETTCLEDRSYTLNKDQLATCVPIGKVLLFKKQVYQMKFISDYEE